MRETTWLSLLSQGPKSLLVAALVVVPAGAGFGAELFSNRMWVVGAAPIWLAAGDLDRDGLEDMVVANSGGHNVSVLRGREGGGFGAQEVIPAGIVPTSVALADLNKDGILDLIVTDEGSDDLGVWVGVGDGSFVPGSRFTCGSSPGSAKVGDFNRDGSADAIVANLGSGDVSLLLGRGDGNFREQIRFAAGGDPVQMALGDFNNDGIPDVAVANALSAGTVSVLLGRPDTGFTPPAQFEAGISPVAIDTGDVNRDGTLDLVVANFSTIAGGVTFLVGNGDGTFGAPIRTEVGDFPFAVALADLDQDGILDVVVASFGSNQMSVLLGNGDGGFRLEGSYEVGARPVFVLPRDLDRDGMPDLISVNSSSDDLSVLLTRGGRGFLMPRRFGAGRAPLSIASDDLNGDGRADLVVANFGLLGPGFPLKSDVSILLGDGSGAFGPDLRVQVGPFPISVALGDVNGDRALDAVVGVHGGGGCDFSGCYPPGSGVSLLLGNGNGSFAEEERLEFGFIQAVALGKLDNDGALDLAIAQVRNELVEQPAQVSVLPGSGDGAFGTGAPSLVGVLPRAIVHADLDSNGIQDLIVANEAFFELVEIVPSNELSRELRYLNYLSSGRVTGRVLGPAVLEEGSVRKALASSGGQEGSLGCLPMDGDVSILFGLGEGAYAPERRLPAGCRTSDVVTADFNEDGFLDLAAVNAGSRDVWVWLGRGDGTFEGESRYRVGTFPRALVARDFSLDGRVDLAVVNAGGNSVSILPGSGDGTFVTEMRFLAGPGANALTVGDFNGDGKLDIVTANVLSNDVSVLLNQGVRNVRIQAPATISWRSQGRVRLTILSDSGFQASTLILSSMRLNGKGVLESGASGKTQCQSRDVDADTLPDLVCHMPALGLESATRESTLVFEALTSEGMAVRGETSVRVVP